MRNARKLSNEQHFERMVNQGFNKVPVIAQRHSDLDTPLALYLKLVGTPGEPGTAHSFLLESVVAAERFGRYSFIGREQSSRRARMGFAVPLPKCTPMGS
jgi:anthranilate synthase component I